MLQSMLAIPPILVGLLVAYALSRAVLRSFLDYRLKVSLLRKLEANPDMVESRRQLHELFLESEAGKPGQSRVDWRLVGVLLAALGFGAAAAAHYWGTGRWWVGAYVGGVASVALGAVFVLAGLFMDLMARLPRR